MPSLKRLSRVTNPVTSINRANWFPGHMYSGLKAMMGKLNTVDCVLEVHDARIPFTGRNIEFRHHLGTIKPHILVLNKTDLADLSKWDLIERKLKERGDHNIFLTDLTGTEFSFGNRGYTNLMSKVVEIVNLSDGFNRQNSNELRIMIVGIPNVGKSTLINRLRQHHLGIKGAPAKVGAMAGVTRVVNTKIKICARPPIYLIDTPGVLEPVVMKSSEKQMPLALCSTITDKVLDPEMLACYLLKFFNEKKNFMYQEVYDLEKPIHKPIELYQSPVLREKMVHVTRDIGIKQERTTPDLQRMCWHFIRDFRRGLLGKVLFD